MIDVDCSLTIIKGAPLAIPLAQGSTPTCIATLVGVLLLSTLCSVGVNFVVVNGCVDVYNWMRPCRPHPIVGMYLAFFPWVNNCTGKRGKDGFL